MSEISLCYLFIFVIIKSVCGLGSFRVIGFNTLTKGGKKVEQMQNFDF